jgi:hypothetical protein
LTGAPLAVLQPLRFHPSSHLVIEFSRSCESVTIATRLPAGSARRPSMAAVYSMRLLVVAGSPPERSIGSPPPGGTTIAAQPPGPGLPLHAPSVQTSASPGRASTGVSAIGALRRRGRRAGGIRRERLARGAGAARGPAPVTVRSRLR